MCSDTDADRLHALLVCKVSASGIKSCPYQFVGGVWQISGPTRGLPRGGDLSQSEIVLSWVLLKEVRDPTWHVLAQQVEAVKREMADLDAMSTHMAEEAYDSAKQRLLMKLYRTTGPTKVKPAVEHISNLLAQGWSGTTPVSGPSLLTLQILMLFLTLPSHA